MVGADGGKAEFEIFDEQLGKMRSVEYRDIVILMRSPGSRVNDYVEVLQSAGVPVRPIPVETTKVCGNQQSAEVDS